MTKTDVIRLRIDPDTKQALQALAAQQGRTVSNLLGLLIQQALETGGNNGEKINLRDNR